MTLSSTLLYEAKINLASPIPVGQTPEGFRSIFHITGGTFEGDRLTGQFLPSGGEWARTRSDGSIAVDVRSCLETDDGAFIYVTYGGRLVIPPELIPKVLGSTSDAPVDPSLYYFRVLPLFETGSEKYAWLNNICAVGVGQVAGNIISYSVYAID